MSTNILESVKEFLVRLVKDEAFRIQLQTNSIDEVRKVLQKAGYIFSKEEFETATIELLDLKEHGEFQELSEEELVTVVGGLAQGIQSQPGAGPAPSYGAVWPWNQFPQPSPQIPTPSFLEVYLPWEEEEEVDPEFEQG